MYVGKINLSTTSLQTLYKTVFFIQYQIRKLLKKENTIALERENSLARLKLKNITKRKHIFSQLNSNQNKDD
jgi:hypothetical protein